MAAPLPAEGEVYPIAFIKDIAESELSEPSAG